MALLWTSPDDVRSRWVGDVVLDATDAQLETLLGDVEDSILAEFPDLPGRISVGFPVLRVRKVAARVAIRHLRNPAGVRSANDAAGPFSSNVTHGGDEPGAPYLTDADRAELGGTLERRAFVVDLVPSYFANRVPLDPSIDPNLWP